MRTIPLTRGYETVVDDEDYERLSAFKWTAYPRSFGGKPYVVARRGARSGGKVRSILMHRQILDAPEGMDVDHKNGNPLDNRRENLRLCTKAQNSQNTPNKKRGRALYRGVCKNSRGRYWNASICADGSRIALGYTFDSPEAAALAYNEAAARLHGEFAVLNDIGGGSHG